MLEELTRAGFVHLTCRSEEQVQECLKTLGQVIHTADVVVKPDSRGLVTSARGLDYHTDHHKAKYVALYCYRQTDEGGESILIDAEKIYLKLSPEQQEQLKEIELFVHKVFHGDQELHPLVAFDDLNTRRFYYSFWLVKDRDKERPAMLAFQKFLRETEPIRLRLEKNDVLIIDNHRMLHGRTPITGSKDRFLKRFWLSPE